MYSSYSYKFHYILPMLVFFLTMRNIFYYFLGGQQTMKGRSYRLVHRMNLTSPQSKHTILIKSHVCKTYVFKFNVLLVKLVYPFCEVYSHLFNFTDNKTFVLFILRVSSSNVHSVLYRSVCQILGRKKPWACSIQQLIVWHCV